MTEQTDRAEPVLATYMPESAERLRRLFERLDPAFAALWSAHMARLLGRDQLDQRTRFLVLTGQYTVARMTPQLEETLDAALAAGVPAPELLEIILQCYVYTGPWVVAAACEAFGRVLDRSPERWEPVSVSDREPRRLEDERQTWSESDGADPRLETLLDRYGWEGLSTGLRLRPGHHIDLAGTLDALDPEFLQTWLDAVYGGMYNRRVVDDRTRLLCVVGATLAIGESHQSRRHMRAALRCGAQPREVLEVVFLTTAAFGHPHVMPAAIDDLVRIVDDEGRLDQLVGPERIEEVRRVAAARAARRGGIQDDPNREPIK